MQPKQNPKFNSKVDPNRNREIDPRRNPSLNPKVNGRINPRNSAFQGYCVYDLHLKQVGFIVPANNKVILCFDPDGNFQQFGVKQNENGSYSIFDMHSNEQIGFTESYRGNAFKLYSVDGELTGIGKKSSSITEKRKSLARQLIEITY
jgi:hypothetical protein